MPHPNAIVTCPSHLSCSGLTALAASLTTRSWGDHGCDIWSCAAESLVANRRPSCCDFLPLTPLYLGHVLARALIYHGPLLGMIFIQKIAVDRLAVAKVGWHGRNINGSSCT